MNVDEQVLSIEDKISKILICQYDIQSCLLTPTWQVDVCHLAIRIPYFI